MKQTKKEHLTKLHKDLSYYNRMAPFPIYDTEYVSEVGRVLESMNDDIDYDSLPVVACTYCNSLHITMEDIEHGEPVDVCNRCFSVGETQEFKNIEEYNKYLSQNEGN